MLSVYHVRVFLCSNKLISDVFTEALIFLGINCLIIYMKKIFHSDWLRAVQVKCNTVQKVSYHCKLHVEILDYDSLINNRVLSEPIKSFAFKSSSRLDGAISFPRLRDTRAFPLLNDLEFSHVCYYFPDSYMCCL